MLIDKPIPRKNLNIKSLNWSVEKKWKVMPIYKSNWIDSLESFKLDDNEINLITKYINKNENEIIKWDINLIKNSNLIISKHENIFNINSKYNVLVLKKRLIVYSFSTPILFRKKAYALIHFNITTNSAYTQTINKGIVIMKKNNGKWMYIGKVFENDLE